MGNNNKAMFYFVSDKSNKASLTVSKGTSLYSEQIHSRKDIFMIEAPGKSVGQIFKKFDINKINRNLGN